MDIAYVIRWCNTGGSSDRDDNLLKGSVKEMVGAHTKENSFNKKTNIPYIIYNCMLRSGQMEPKTWMEL